jgi:Sel1 repeat
MSALVTGWWLYGRMDRSLHVAREQKAVADEQSAQADRILEDVITKFLPQMDVDTKKELLAVFQTGADHGDAISMGILGWLYHHGRGVAQDYAKAREWYEKAADKGDRMAMLNLGGFYTFGHGGAQDYAKAREWLEKAADEGVAEARGYLEKLSIEEAAKAGRYAEALQRQEAYEAKVEGEEIKRKGKPSEETARALGQVAWYALFAREFTKALTASDRAHALLPDDLTVETNRAHALMFLGRGEEAKALCLTYKGKAVSEEDATLWERAIVEDFAEFRKAGLTHPMMADIEKELGVSP